MYADNLDTLNDVKNILNNLHYIDDVCPQNADHLHNMVNSITERITPPISETVNGKTYLITGGVMDPSTTMIIMIYYDKEEDEYIPHLAHDRDDKIDYSSFKMFGVCKNYDDAVRIITMMLTPLHVQDCFSNK
jgi:hypothetical protein